MDGVEEAKQVAAGMGIDAPFEYNFSEKELAMLGWNYTKYLEYFLDPAKTDNVMFLISGFRSKS